MADDLNATLLRGLLPALYKEAQAGDRAATDRIIRIIGQLERLEGAPTVPEGFTAPPTVPGQPESRLSRDKLHARLADLQAQDAAPPAWLELYDSLLAERTADGHQRWDWRKALYIAWSCVPRSKREPKTLGALADRLGVRTSTMRMWRIHDPEIEQRIADLPHQVLLDHVADVYAATIEVASTPDPRCTAERQLFYKLAGILQSQVELGGSLNLDHTSKGERITGFVNVSPDDWEKGDAE
jgi:hypothetical protein